MKTAVFCDNLCIMMLPLSSPWYNINLIKVNYLKSHLMEGSSKVFLEEVGFLMGVSMDSYILPSSRRLFLNQKPHHLTMLF